MFGVSRRKCGGGEVVEGKDNRRGRQGGGGKREMKGGRKVGKWKD